MRPEVGVGSYSTKQLTDGGEMRYIDNKEDKR